MEKSLSVERNYGIDLLRIVSMYMVVVLHLLGGDEILEYFSLCSWEYELAWLLELIAFPAVNCYALISGYVAINAKYRYSNIIMLWLQVFFYSVIISVIFAVLFPDIVNWESILGGFFPTLTKQYWYFTAYVGLFFFIPALRVVIDKTSQKELKRVLMAGFVLLSVCPMLVNADIYNSADGYSMLWLCYLFLVGAYIKKYNAFKELKTRTVYLMFFGCLIVTLGLKFVIEYVSWNYLEKLVISSYLTKYTSPLIFIEAIMVLLIFSRMSLADATKKIIKFLAPLSFSVYLIHNHELMRVHLIVPLRSALYQNSIWGLMGGVIITAAIIFVVCVAIDYIRQQLFKTCKVKERVVSIDRHFNTE